MTLVVGRRSPHGLSILSDSRVTDPHDPRPKPLVGTLKVIVLDPKHCFAFAGAVPFAQDAVEVLFAAQRSAGVTTDLIVEHLLHVHRESGQATDFLVGSLEGDPRLTKIADGQAQSGLSAAWLGNQDAFAEYQRRFLSAPVDEKVDATDSMAVWKELRERAHGAFITMVIDTVSGEPSFPDVGDFPVIATSTKEGFCYISSVHAFPFNEGAVNPPQGEWIQVPIGGAREGGYAFAVLTPDEVGVCAVGVHFAQGRFGILMCPAVSREVVFIDGLGHREFIEAVRARYGYDLHAPRLALGGTAEPW